jgi:nucleoside-diphosphate-sugar epimerase
VGKKTILCTGAGGFIGRRLVPRLVESGDEVWALLGPGDEPDPGVGGDVHWVRGDITDPSTLTEIRRPFSAVFHLAALSWSPDPARFYRVNTQGTVNVATAILEGGRPDRFLFTSSYGAVGPATDSAGLSEDSPCQRLWAEQA